MRTLEDVESWYKSTIKLLSLFRRIGAVYWERMPWDGAMAKDERFKTVDGVDITREADLVLGEFDDLAVFVMFSVFEANLRDFVLREMAPEAAQLSHVALKRAVEEATQRVEEGSLYTNVLRIWTKSNADQVEMVNQIRRYRNWVAHGRRPDKKPEAAVEPVGALQRLQGFLTATGYTPATGPPDPHPPTEAEPEPGPGDSPLR